MATVGQIHINQNNALTVIQSSRKAIWVKNKLFKTIFNASKRGIDIIGGIVGITILVPITCALFLIKLIKKEKGSLFFYQERIGKNGQPFKLYKFRTMIPNADEVLEKILKNDEKARKEYKVSKKLKNDPRVTIIGKFLRKTSLDEFPQFINVLKGDMSLVGPRPYLLREKEDMGYYYYYVTKCKPGLTGLWQVPLFSDNGILQSAKGVA